MGQFSDMALLRVLQLWTQSESLRCSIRRLLPYFTCENTRHSLGFTWKHCSVWLFSFDTFSPDTDPLLVNKRHFQGNVSKPQSQNKHVGYTADINLMSLICTGYRLHSEKGGASEPLMLKNKYKAFQNSFNPHTSLTAGLNIFEKTFHSRRKRMHTLLHMQINMTTKPELKEIGLCLTTIPSKPIQKKENPTLII